LMVDGAVRDLSSGDTRKRFIAALTLAGEE